MGSNKDLSGLWLGRYLYPIAGVPPVTFDVVLYDLDGALTGTVTEVSPAGQRLSATISGQRNGGHVHFLKLYDAMISGYDDVVYDGQIGDEGREISGRWTIADNWSGDFIMIRKSGDSAEVERKETVKIGENNPAD